jgi:molecular chaperone HtpG
MDEIQVRSALLHSELGLDYTEYDEKFFEKAKDFCLLEDTDGKYFTFTEYDEAVQAAQTDKDGNKVYLYTSDRKLQDSFIQSAKTARK